MKICKPWKCRVGTGRKPASPATVLLPGTRCEAVPCGRGRQRSSCPWGGISLFVLHTEGGKMVTSRWIAGLLSLPKSESQQHLLLTVLLRSVFGLLLSGRHYPAGQLIAANTVNTANAKCIYFHLRFIHATSKASFGKKISFSLQGVSKGFLGLPWWSSATENYLSLFFNPCFSGFSFRSLFFPAPVVLCA